MIALGNHGVTFLIILKRTFINIKIDTYKLCLKADDLSKSLASLNKVIIS